MLLVGREVPKINGSAGGFIALVVCLSVLIVGLFVAVFILLRDYEPTDEERSVRRQLSQRRREQQQSDPSSPFTYTSSSTAPVTLAQKIGGIFGMGTATNENSGGRKTKKGGKRGRGWVQASGDEWGTQNEVQTRSLSGLQTPKDVRDVHGIRLSDRSMANDGGPFDHPSQPLHPSYSSNSSVQELYIPFVSSSTMPPLHIVTTLSPHSPSSPSLLSTSSAARALSGSPEPYATGPADNDLRPDGERQLSAESGGSISTRTSHTGTKFIESLE